MSQKYGIGSETDYIEKYKRGDMEGFRQIYDLYKNRVWSIALHYTYDESIASDITQQIFLKLFTGVDKFRGESKLSTWLYRITVNACMDEHRKHRKTMSLEDMTDKKSPEIMNKPVFSSNQEHQIIHIERSEAVNRAVLQMKPKLRIAILLRYFEDMSYEEIAEILNCSIGTVASRLNRGHRELARKLRHIT